jgi:hypothetical protein
MTDSRELHEEGGRLIVAAFEAARHRGVPEWRRMTSAVLKNRLLALTNREFTERRWGAATFGQFLSQYPDLVAVDASRHPPIVELRDQEQEDSGRETPTADRAITAAIRIRPDLWRAVLDYSSGRAYAWDADSSTAVPASPPNEETRPVLPTVSEETYSSWRAEFARENVPLVSPRHATTIERWRSDGLPTTQLPPALRGPWNAALKRHVLETLETWFAAHEIEPPDDLIAEERPTRAPSPTTESLRDLVLACVAVMTREELESLNLPAAVVLRTERQGIRRDG